MTMEIKQTLFKANATVVINAGPFVFDKSMLPWVLDQRFIKLLIGVGEIPVAINQRMYVHHLHDRYFLAWVFYRIVFLCNCLISF